MCLWILFHAQDCPKSDEVVKTVDGEADLSLGLTEIQIKGNIRIKERRNITKADAFMSRNMMWIMIWPSHSQVQDNFLVHINPMNDVLIAVYFLQVTATSKEAPYSHHSLHDIVNQAQIMSNALLFYFDMWWYTGQQMSLTVTMETWLQGAEWLICMRRNLRAKLRPINATDQSRICLWRQLLNSNRLNTYGRIWTELFIVIITKGGTIYLNSSVHLSSRIFWGFSFNLSPSSSMLK